VPDCGGAITAGGTIIKSPGYDEFGNYFNNLNCLWTIDMPDASGIALYAEEFNVESDDTCRYDFLKIKDVNGNSRGIFCGRSVNNMSIDTSTRKRRSGEKAAARTDLRDTNYVPMWAPVYLEHGDRIRFKTDDSVVNPGFILRIDTDQQNVGDCGQTLSGSGIVTSPGFGFPAAYNNNDACEYSIQAEPGKHIRIRFTHFEVEQAEPDGSGCIYDLLTIRSQWDRRVYCGYDNDWYAPPAEEMVFESDWATISWATDDSVTRRGWRFEFESFTPNQPVSQEPEEFWEHWRQMFPLVKAQMEAGPRPWKTPLFTWLFNRIERANPEAYSQTSGECEWAVRTGNDIYNPTYEHVEITYFDESHDRCENLLKMGYMGSFYLRSYVCMTGHPQPRGTIRR